MPDARHPADAPARGVPATRPRPPPPAGEAAGRVMELVYEDEHVLMEWSVRTPAADTVAVTFDPILVDPSGPSYAAAFLHRLGVDTLCVRKKTEHFYQPLSRASFDAAAGPVLARYRRRLAYGSSLGAYAVLYFCAHGFERVISSSPRVSAHPRFGRAYWQDRQPFLHEFFDAGHPATSGAVVFYDPHDDMDRHFVDEGLRPGWPHAQFVAVPYAGHPSNHFLSEIGYISPFVQAIVAGKPPPALDRRGSKARSFSYRHVLAMGCLRHHKPRWAESLCLQALSMKPQLVNVKLTLGQALLAQGRLDDAEPLLLEFQQAYPEDGDARHALRSIARERARRQRRQAWPQLGGQLRRRVQGLRGRLAAWRDRPGLAALWLTGHLRLSVTREDIEWCYLHLLGRRPESPRALLAHRRCLSFERLVRAFAGSAEYGRDLGAAELEQLVHTAALLRRVLPAGGRLVDVSAAGFFSPPACERIDPPPDPAGDGPGPPAPETGPGGADLVMNSEPLRPESDTAGGQLRSMAALLAPGGQLLLASRGAPGAVDALLRTQRLEPVASLALAGEPAWRLTLARRRL